MRNHVSTILIFEDEPDASHSLETVVKSLSYSVLSVQAAEEILAFLRDPKVEISAILLSLAMLSQDGLDILREIRSIDGKLPVILVAGSSSTRDVVAALRNGASDFLCKSVIHGELGGILATALENHSPACRYGVRSVKLPMTFESTNPRVEEIESRVGPVGWSGVPVLIQGETGSGKEVLARKLHAQSARASKPFLKLNCAALPSELVESELFGYERGAFTGAFEKKAGIFELADGGTILLDEIGDMDIRLQAKLLQVLQDQEFRRIGGKELVKVNVRIMAATHRDLEKAIHEREFREDLYYRLNVIVLQVPPLRERIQDIVPLGEFLIRKHADQKGPIPEIHADLTLAMTTYNWPGNVRELENYMRKLVIFRDPDAIASDLRKRMSRKSPALVRSTENHVTSVERRDELPILERVTKVNRQAEADAILTALDATRWNRKHAAVILKIDYKSLLYKMKKLRIDDHATSRSALFPRHSSEPGVPAGTDRPPPR